VRNKETLQYETDAVTKEWKFNDGWKLHKLETWSLSTLLVVQILSFLFLRRGEEKGVNDDTIVTVIMLVLLSLVVVVYVVMIIFHRTFFPKDTGYDTWEGVFKKLNKARLSIAHKFHRRSITGGTGTTTTTNGGGGRGMGVLAEEEGGGGGGGTGEGLAMVTMGAMGGEDKGQEEGGGGEGKAEGKRGSGGGVGAGGGGGNNDRHGSSVGGVGGVGGDGVDMGVEMGGVGGLSDGAISPTSGRRRWTHRQRSKADMKKELASKQQAALQGGALQGSLQLEQEQNVDRVDSNTDTNMDTRIPVLDRAAEGRLRVPREGGGLPTTRSWAQQQQQQQQPLQQQGWQQQGQGQGQEQEQGQDHDPAVHDMSGEEKESEEVLRAEQRAAQRAAEREQRAKQDMKEKWASASTNGHALASLGFGKRVVGE
jgi:hypothetical protein